MSIGKKLKEIRLNQKKTLKEVSNTIDVSIGFVSRIENGSSKPSLETLIKLCNYYGVDVSEITVNETLGRINENNIDLYEVFNRLNLAVNDYELSSTERTMIFTIINSFLKIKDTDKKEAVYETIIRICDIANK